MKSSGISLRQATVDDVGEYLRILASVRSPINLVTTDILEALDEIRDAIVMGIYYNGLLAGFATYRERSSGHAYIAELAIHPDFQGRGIGSETIELLLAEFREKGMATVTLVTHHANPALRLYMRHGFEVIGNIANYEESGTPRLILSRSV